MDISAADYKTLKGYVGSKIFNKADAEDFVQESCLKALEKSELFRAESKVSTWLCAIAHNTMAKEFKHQDTVVGRGLIGGLEVDGLQETQPSDPMLMLERKESTIELDRVLRLINPASCKTLKLVFFSGMTYAEAGDEMGVPENTAKSRVNKACAAMQLAYGDNVKSISVELTDEEYLAALPGTTSQIVERLGRTLSSVKNRLARMSERGLIHVSHSEKSPLRNLRVNVYAAGPHEDYLHTDGSVVIPPRHELMSALFGEWA